MRLERSLPLLGLLLCSGESPKLGQQARSSVLWELGGSTLLISVLSFIRALFLKRFVILGK